MSEKTELAARLTLKIWEVRGEDSCLPKKRALAKDLVKLNMATIQGLLDLFSALRAETLRCCHCCTGLCNGCDNCGGE